MAKPCKLMEAAINRTNKGFQRTVRAVGQEHGLRKKLEPYSPNAPRNRPKETVCASICINLGCIGISLMTGASDCLQ